jgi:hypothetical protein
MEMIYVVYYDNGQPYEDHYTSVERIFASRESAEKFLNEKIQNLVFNIESKEEYEKDLNTDEPHYTYDEYYKMRWDEWHYYLGEAKYYIREYALNA